MWLHTRSVLAILLLAPASGCGGKPPETTEVRAPFSAQYANFKLEVPERPDLHQATKYDFGLKMHICDRSDHKGVAPRLCEGFAGPVVNQFGVTTFVIEPRADKQFVLLKERPANAAEPPHLPLVPVAEELIPIGSAYDTEAGELGRVSRARREAPLTTTANGWPMVTCGANLVQGWGCGIGFLIEGAFIEANFSTEEGIRPNQKQIWDLATALDEKLRALSPPPSS